MAGGSGYNFPEDGRIDEIVKDLIRRVEDIERLTRAGTTAIDDGALEVRQDGVPKVKVGQLDDGTYGMSVYDSAGVAMPLSQLAFGLAAVSDDSTIVPPLNSWGYGGPAVTVNITTGRCVVIVSAYLWVYELSPGSPTSVAMSWDIYNPTTSTEVVSPAAGRALAVELAPNMGIRGSSLQSSFAYVHQGLTPGTYIVRSRYSILSTGGSPGTGEASYRSIIVLPY